jgi:UDPglucose 6-dehydrogenase
MVSALGKSLGEQLILIPAIKQSNDRHKDWAFEKLERLLGSFAGKTIAVLGLTYKPFTDTLRRSSALELCRRVLETGGAVHAFDPAVKQMPPNWQVVTLAPAAEAVLSGADAAVVCTPWPQFRKLDWSACVPTMRHQLVLDAQGFLRDQLQGLPGLEYHSVGSPA